MKVGLISLGCSKNQVDAEKLIFSLQESGFEFCSELAECDVVVINTCGFIENAKQESINSILEVCGLKKYRTKPLKVVITGCLAQRYREQILQNIPEADVVLGIGANKDIANLISRSFEEKHVEEFSQPEKFSMEGGRYRIFKSPTAYIKIAEGCDNRCSYCAIPLIRGSFRSRRIENILAEVQELVLDGAVEINLVAQDTTRYGLDLYGKLMLPELISEISKISGVKWIRLLYCHPDRITDELLEEMAKDPKVLKYLDIPLQHIDARLLEAMNRSGDGSYILDRIAKVRAKVPGVVLRTTMIVGFPGESGVSFEKLCRFVQQARFERLGCFAYSQEEGTKAATLPDQIEDELKNMRVEALMDIQSLVIEEFSSSLVGRTFDVLVEHTKKNGDCIGRTYMDAPEVDGQVLFKSLNCSVGDIIKVKIVDYEGYDLVGEV